MICDVQDINVIHGMLTAKYLSPSYRNITGWTSAYQTYLQMKLSSKKALTCDNVFQIASIVGDRAAVTADSITCISNLGAIYVEEVDDA